MIRKYCCRVLCIDSILAISKGLVSKKVELRKGDTIISVGVLKNRILTLRKLILQYGLDTLIVSDPANKYYLTGYLGSNSFSDDSTGVLLITRSNFILMTDERFFEQARIESFDCDIILQKSSFAKEMIRIMNFLGSKNIGFEGGHVTYKMYNEYLNCAKKLRRKASIVAIEGLVESMREIKADEEIFEIREALKLAEAAFQNLLTIIKPGMSEKEVAWIFEKIIKKSGADCLAFPTIVASGPNSAFPHAKLTNRKIKHGEPVLFDWGIRYKQYCSDTSRTVVFGTPSDKFTNIYNTVVEAQKKATSIIKPGIRVNYSDKVAREHINSKGYFGKFTHSLGHGIGLEVHESPKISRKGNDVFKKGMSITIEPGIYLPGWGGIRNENQYLLNEDGLELLNENEISEHFIC